LPHSSSTRTDTGSRPSSTNEHPQGHRDRRSGTTAVLHAVGGIHSIDSETQDQSAAKIARNLRAAAASATSAIYVAETPDGEVAGYCAVHWIPFLFQQGGEAYITELFIRPRDAGNGIGTRLLDLVIAQGRERGCARLSLLNGRDSEAYRREFYARRGWTERDRMANFILPLP